MVQKTPARSSFLAVFLKRALSTLPVAKPLPKEKKNQGIKASGAFWHFLMLTCFFSRMQATHRVGSSVNPSDFAFFELMSILKVEKTTWAWENDGRTDGPAWWLVTYEVARTQLMAISLVSVMTFLENWVSRNCKFLMTYRYEKVDTKLIFMWASRAWIYRVMFEDVWRPRLPLSADMMGIKEVRSTNFEICSDKMLITIPPVSDEVRFHIKFCLNVFGPFLKHRKIILHNIHGNSKVLPEDERIQKMTLFCTLLVVSFHAFIRTNENVLTPHTRSLAPPGSLCSPAPLHSLVCSLAHYLPSSWESEWLTLGH